MMLSSRLLRRPVGRVATRGAVLSRMPALRPSKRTFHASAARRGPWLDTFLFLPHEMMSLLHAQVPWYAAIPLTAFILRGLLVTTAGGYARALMARYIGLHPLRQALAIQKRDEVLKRGNFRKPKDAVLQVKREVKQVITQLDKRWKVSLKGQVSWTLLQLPIFFGMAEAIRQKCGARDGLLGLGASLCEKVASNFRSENAGKPNVDSALDAGESVASYAPELSSLAGDPASQAGELSGSLVSNIGEHAVAQSHWFEPSLANEGLLWFQDLVIPDPTGVLPFIVSGLMFCNIYFTPNTIRSGANWPNAIRKLLLVVTLLVGPLCQDLPAALMLYWASSTTSVIVWNRWLDWKYPAPRGHVACKRPLLMPPARRGRRL